MDKKKVFCEECRKDVDYTICEEQLSGTIKGETYSYMGREASAAPYEKSRRAVDQYLKPKQDIQ